MYLLIVSDHGRNNQMNELTFYPLAKWVAENGGYVHWAWWNNLLYEYMARPLGGAPPVPVTFPPGGPPSQPEELEPEEMFADHPGTPTVAYPGLVERGWFRDGLVSIPIVEHLLEVSLYSHLERPEVRSDPHPTSNSAFVADARKFLQTIRTVNQEALIFAVGHGFGAGSLNDVFEGITDVDIDLVGLIDPVSAAETPTSLRTDPNTHRGSQWRAKRKSFLGYRQADCIRNTFFPFLCKNFASGFFQFDYRCERLGRAADTPSGWLSSPPAFPSRAPLQCKGPIIHAGTPYRTFTSAPNIRKIVQHFQPESRIPINPNPAVLNLLTCRDFADADPILKTIIEQGAAHEGALPLPDSLKGGRPPAPNDPSPPTHPTKHCNPDDGHDELIGDRGHSVGIDPHLVQDCEFAGLPRWRMTEIALFLCETVGVFVVRDLIDHLIRPGNEALSPVTRQTARLPLGTLVTGLGRGGLSEVQQYVASIGRPMPTEAWPACATCDNGPDADFNARNVLPLDMVYSANTESRRLALISMASPGPWAFQPLFPELCLVCDKLIEIASSMLDENTPADTAAPTTTAQSSPEPNGHGWIAEDMVITLSATDNAGGSGVREIAVSTSGAESVSTVHSGASGETPISTEGITTVTFSARDHEDNEESPAQSLVVRIDKTAPTIEYVAAPPPNAFGWNNTDVTVSYSGSDSLSGLAELSPNAPIVVTTEGKDQEITGYAVDLAGNESGAGPTVSIDRTPPEIVAIRDVAANGHGWHNSDVRVTFEASDALSGIASSSPETVVSTEGAGQIISGTAEDFAGNAASTSATLDIDKTAPVITAVTDIAANSFGWNSTDVRVSFTASDTLSGLAFTSPETLVSTEGAGQQVDGTATDRADNTANTSVTLNIDKTAPQITAAANIAPNGNGWNSGDVVVSFAASDALSGIAFSTPDVVVSTEGAAQAIAGTARDRADHTASATLVVNIDKTAPVIALANRTPANGAGWNNTDVSLTWNCSDALSGPVVDQVSHSVSGEGAAQNAIATCADRAGHSASDTQAGINIDKTSPTSEMVTPAHGAVYLLNAIVNAAYGCADALSGVSACAGAVASGAALDTATVGDKTFTVSAADAAGNHSAGAHLYSVQYAFSGFSNPIAALPSVNTANAGRTVPVKYALRDVNGAVISDLTSFASLTSAPVACDSNVPTAAAEETDAAGSTTIHFDSGQFIYNWKTQSAWAGTCRMLQLTLSDGTRHMVSFQFK